MIARADVPATPRSILSHLFAGSADATASEMLEEAAARARSDGFVVLSLGWQAGADIRELASFHAAIALQCVRHGAPMVPTAIVSGGPVSESAGLASPADFLLALALALNAQQSIYAYACGPDARADRSSSFGVYIDPDTLARGRTLAIDLAKCLTTGEARSVFERLGDYRLLTAAPVDASVLRAILITQP